MFGVRRVVVVGSGGSGKSTLAVRLGQVLGVPVIHLDRLYWRPGWVATPGAEWRAVQEGLVRAEAWVIDGNYGATLDIRFAAADAVIFLDLSPWLCTWRVLRRWWMHRGQAVQASGCPTRITPEFVAWVWRYRRRSRPRVMAALARAVGHADVHVLRTRLEVEAFLGSQP